MSAWQTAGAPEAFDALDLADRLIERAYGGDTPPEWTKAYRGVAKARALASPVSGDGSSADADTHPAPVPPVVGWQDISTAPRQEPVIVGHERLLGWRRMAICNALGEWSYYDRPWLQQDPLDEAPTHWMAWPDAPPTASVSPGMETLQASECTKTTNGETIAQTCLRLADDRTLNIIPAVRCALRMAHDALTTTKHGEGDQ